MSIPNNVTNPSFKGVYKVTMPNVNSIKDEKEKQAATEAIINTLVMGSNLSVAEPRVEKGNDVSIYFKVNDKNDQVFENGFKNILAECNRVFNTDMAKKVYYKKVDNAEYDKADKIQ